MKFSIDPERIKCIREARKRRHEKSFIPQESVFVQETNKQIETVFFWRVVTIATLGLFFFSLVPQFAVFGNFRTIPEEVINAPRDSIAFGEDGYIMKPELWNEKGDRSDVSGVIDHVVKKGDTFASIAEKYGVKEETIAQNNPKFSSSRLKVGAVLKIPSNDGLVHTVARGDTLGSIAQKYKIDLKKILAQNEMTADSTLVVGQEIIIPGAKRIIPSVVSRPSYSTGGYIKNTSRAPGRDTGGTLLFPTKGVYTQGYHYGHYAVDIAKSGGAPIWAAESGTVIRARGGWNGGYGNYVIIDHGNGMTTLYAHMRERYVNVGDYVSRGDQIGYMGNTGNVRGRTGIHLHFEVRVNGRKMNPKLYF